MNDERLAKPDDGILRVVLTADNHLSAYSPKLSPAKLMERRRRLGMAFKQSVDTAIERRAHIFVQAGDLFDTVDPRNKERDFVAEQLGRLRSTGICTFGVSGNHDTPRQRTEQGGIAPQGVYHRLRGMHFFDSSDSIEPVLIDVAGLHVAIAGLSYRPNIPPGGDPLDQIQIADPQGLLAQADLGILILHAAIEGHAFPGEMETFVRRSSLPRLEGFHVVLAGHVHAYDRFSIGDKTIVVCGATELMEFGQSADTVGFVYLELTQRGLRGAEHVPIMPQPRHVITLRTTELWPAQLPQKETSLAYAQSGVVQDDETLLPTVTERILQKIEPYCTPDALVRLRLEGPITRDQYHELDLRGIWLYGQQRAFSFEIDESYLSLSSDFSLEDIERGERVAPRETLEKVIQEQMVQADNPEFRALLTKTRQRVLDRYDELSGKEPGQ
ncbi:nuclease [Ktedonobacter sp. SOSP1-85]|uniref:metallophosphoesterase family protein n=1 Tax=Ktedonobacter sp. SOSP1-85 TaxID=2778367 RepID=UPI0019166414|nr:metallophosphoesterase [Ktedonobacter sp. SOSP1-85]GHO79961.1 nuclease [Ktedonobacter sp. SOSP1-85]